MVVTKLISGLGNQLFQYAVGRQISIKNNVPFKLDISFYQNQSLRSYKLNHYNTVATIASEADINELLDIYKKKNVFSKLYCKAEKYLPKYYIRYYKEDEWWVYEPQIANIFRKVYLEGYWQHYKYFVNLDRQIFKELSVNDSSNSEYASLLNAIRDVPCSVSIHIRRGDYITDKTANNLMGILPLSYYQNAINYMLERHKTASFYIFSDDLNWVKDNLYINAPTTLVDIDNGTKDYLELDLMSKCNHNIIANSSYSWWGAFLNQNDNKIVIAPRKWVVPNDINNKIQLQFPSWIKL